MAKYINELELLSVLNYKYESIANINSIIIDMKPADVIERSKVDNAIEEIEKTENTQEHTSYDGDITMKGAFNDGMEKALEILKRHIGE